MRRNQDYIALASALRESKPNHFKSNDPMSVARRIQWQRDVVKIMQELDRLDWRFNRRKFLRATGIEDRHIDTLADDAAEWSEKFRRRNKPLQLTV